MSSQACPMCRGGILERGEAHLDQSGYTHLETVAFRCPRCEYARFEPALHARWVSDFVPVARVSLVRRAGAAPERLEPAAPLAA